MESGIKRTQRDYTLAFKLAVVEQVEKGELTYKQAQQRYGIHLSLKMQTPDEVHRASLAGVCRLESPSQVST